MLKNFLKQGRVLSSTTLWAVVHKMKWKSSQKSSTIQKQPSRIVFLGKAVLKLCTKFTGEHPCQNLISIKSQINFIEIALQHGSSSVKLLHIFRTPFLRNTSGWLLLTIIKCSLLLIPEESLKLHFQGNLEY